MDVLGINAFHGDSAAALLRDGALLAGVEEERLNRVKHWAGFPSSAIDAVLAAGQTELSEIRHVAVSRNPEAHLLAKSLFVLRRQPGFPVIRSRLSNLRRVRGLESRLRAAGSGFRGEVHRVEHHRAHLASAFFCSPFERAACLTVDGFGDFLSSMSALGTGNRLEILDSVMFPHSLGIFYTAVTQFLGFPKYGDEYKVMALASYGRPAYLPEMRRIVSLTEDGRFEMDIECFRHASEGVTMSWDQGEPVLGPLWSPKLERDFGAPREPDSELTERHRDLAASLQAMYEVAFFHRLNWLRRRTGAKALCLAGGCAFNSVANGKILARTGFSEVFVQAAAGDAGTALGAAQYLWHQVLARPRTFTMEHSYWGQEFPESRIVAALRERLPGFAGSANEASGVRIGELLIRRYSSEEALVGDTAEAVAQGAIVGWYQGRSEWGPRALGNRSIVADPRRPEVKDVLNARVKHREPFRPFAPSILEERIGDYFEETYPDPFMTRVCPIRPSKRPEIPAVAHVDGTGRLQTVSRCQNPRYWSLIKAFEQRTGVPVLLNTSFNENEPIVNTPEEALDCFLRTKMDRLVMENWVIDRVSRADSGPAPAFS